MTTFRELVAGQDRRRGDAGGASAAAQGALLVDVREADEWAQGHALREPSTSRAASRDPHRGEGPRTRTRRSFSTARAGVRVPGGALAAGAGVRNVVSVTGGFGSGRKPASRSGAEDVLGRAAPALQPPLAGARDRRGRPGEAAGVQGPSCRSGGPWFSGGLYPAAGVGTIGPSIRRVDLEPAAAGAAHERAWATKDGVGGRDAARLNLT